MAEYALSESFDQKDAESQALSNDATSTLACVLDIMTELTAWLVKSGVGYTEFSSALKPLFYNEAIRESEQIHQKKTDSSISLLSGLHRRDVSAFRQENDGHQIISSSEEQVHSNIPVRVISLWRQEKLAHRLPITGEKSFENLVKQVSTEKHPRSILLELKRRGIIIEEGNDVVLQTACFLPRPDLIQTKKLFSANIADHLSAGVHNLIEEDDAFLEQAIFADNLSQKSIDKLKLFSQQLWDDMAHQLLDSAITCSKKDHGNSNATQRFRVGIFCYDNKNNKKI